MAAVPTMAGGIIVLLIWAFFNIVLPIVIIGGIILLVIYLIVRATRKPALSPTFSASPSLTISS